jgi:hypothetical protein
MARILEWNGKDIPEDFRELPAGRYVVEAVDDVPLLTPEEEEGLREAIRSLASGDGRSEQQVREAVQALLAK